jgi:hypothetical protein
MQTAGYFAVIIGAVQDNLSLKAPFRLLKVDTVFSYDPWGHYEENPDHYVTAQAVEGLAGCPAAIWTCRNTSLQV